MPLLPIVDRELRVQARRPFTHRVRWVFGLVGLLLWALISWQAERSASWGGGKSTFFGITFLALVFALVDGVRSTSDCISEEKREGTLGFLFLTDLRGMDVVLGKLAGHGLGSFYAMMALTPMMALPILAGGVTGGEFWRVTLVLLNTLFFSLSAGIFASAWSRSAAAAWRITILLLLLFALAPMVPLLFGNQWLGALLSPIEGYRMMFDGAYRLGPGRFGWSLLTVHGLGWGLLLSAGWKVRRAWHDESEKRITSSSRPVRSFPVGELAPTQWLVKRMTGGFWFPKIVILYGVLQLGFLAWAESVASVMSTAFLQIFALGNALVAWGLLIAVAARATSVLVPARENGALELILVTPLAGVDFWRGLFRGSLPFILWCVAAGLFLNALSTVALFAQLRTAGPLLFASFLPHLINHVSGAIQFVATFFAMYWFASYLALAGGKQNAVLVKTFLAVVFGPAVVISLLAGIIFLPIMTLGVSKVWLMSLLSFVMQIGKDAAFILWSRNRIGIDFRPMAAAGVKGKAGAMV